MNRELHFAQNGQGASAPADKYIKVSMTDIEKGVGITKIPTHGMYTVADFRAAMAKGTMKAASD